MPYDQRGFNRFHIYIVGEFKSLRNPAASFLGITRDFSCGGMSLESQSFDLKPGENLELKFKHPKLDMIVSAIGEIIWKKNFDNFNCVMGIQFREMINSAESKILKIMSTVGNVPVKSFLAPSGTARERIGNKETTFAAPVIAGNALFSHKSVHRKEFEVTYDSDLPAQDRIMHHAQGTGDRAVSVAAARSKHILFTLLIVLAVAAVFVISLPLPLDDPVSSVIMSDTALSTHAGDSARENEPVHQEPVQSPLPEAPEGTVRDMSARAQTAQPEQSLTENKRSETGELYIQVGSWRNPDYAREAWEGLLPYYPEAYLVEDNNFHVVRIPGIMSKKQGYSIMAHIEAKTHLKPLLALRIRDN